jgi:hypothetical protein
MIFLYLCVILVIILVIIGNKSKKEQFSPYIDYSRVYPGTFAYNNPYGTHGKPFYGTIPIENNSRYHDLYWFPRNIRYQPYGDYAYIAGHEYLDNWMNGTASIRHMLKNPVGTYPKCIKQIYNHTGNIDLAITSCIV